MHAAIKKVIIENIMAQLEELLLIPRVSQAELRMSRKTRTFKGLHLTSEGPK